MDHEAYDETQTRRLKRPSVKNQGHCTRKGTRGIILVTFRSPTDQCFSNELLKWYFLNDKILRK